MKADRHPDEAARLAALRSYEILDTGSEPEFDDVVRVVSEICDMPMSVITLIDADRQWFKAKVGLDISETPFEMSVCAHGILQPDMLEIEDMTKDVRTIDNPFVKGAPHARFYAGAALMTDDGFPLGMLCVLDYQPRKLKQSQRDLLQVMARLVMRQIELRKVLRTEHAAHLKVQEILDHANALLDRNAVLRGEIDHRVKNSLTQVAAFLSLQERRHRDEPRIAQALAEARNRVVTVANVHDHLHRAAEDDLVPVSPFLSELAENLSHNQPPQLKAIEVDADATKLSSDKVLALGLAANEAIANAIKHAFRPEKPGVIRVLFRNVDGQAEFTVTDDGCGLPKDFVPTGNPGLGLKVLTSLAQQLGGALSYASGQGGSSFTIRFALPGAA